ncbi:MAG: DNA-processing protein DprA, partial [Bacteroidota bacterium]
MHPDTYARVALSRVPNIGPKLFRALVAYFGSATAVLRARPQELGAVVGVGDRTAAYFQQDDHRREAEGILDHAARNDIDILCCLDEGTFPGRLWPHPTAPPILYHFGATDFSNPRTLAVVGTREMSPQGGRQI